MKHTRWRATLAGVLALALVSLACASSSFSSSSLGETGVTGSEIDCATLEFGCVEVAADAPILLGTLLSVSGDVASLGLDSRAGVELAIDHRDGTLDGTMGQLVGHAINLANEDDLCSADGSQAGGTALAANDQIVAVIGTSCPSAALGAADKLLSDKGILLVSPTNTNPGLTSETAHQPFYLRTAYNDKIQGAIVAEFALNELGATTAATIADESPYAAGLAEAFAANFEAGSGSMTSADQILAADKEFRPLLEAIAQNSPDVLYFPDFNPACALITKQAKEIMPDTALIGSNGCMETVFLEAVGDAAVGVYGSGPDLSAFQSGDFYKNEFLPAYKTRVGTAPTSLFHAHAYDAANILFDAIESVAVDNGDGSLTIPRMALRDAIFATSGYAGLTGTITCNELGDCATDVTIGVFQAPAWPVEGGTPDAAPVYTDTKSLADVI